MIVQIGDKLVVKSKDGSQQFGEYDTEEAAKKRLAEVEAFKHMNNKLQVNVPDNYQLSQQYQRANH